MTQQRVEYPFVIGTAGHIDHGKTSLVRALTGIDCDRLDEEKRRGMTIELGFAPMLLPSGKTISIVDVPGHEKFIRQMVAGAAGVDAVMLVVAADDGVMPQTREHLEILTLLGIRNGLTVINKADLVDEETLEIAKEDVRDLVAGTFLANAPIMAVSALTGAGLPELASAIQSMVENSVPRDRNGAFFLPVDRAFHISGFGTVVTGTALSGAVREGDEVEAMPKALRSKVRSLQVHGEPVESAAAGQRVAVNLAGVSLDDVKREDVVTAVGRFGPTECLDVYIEVLPSFGEPLEHWQRLRLHIGTSDVLVRLSLLERDKVPPNEAALAQLLTEEPITVSAKSRFILRTYSPLRTVAGGRVLLSRGERPKNKETRAALVRFLRAIKDGAEVRDRLEAFVAYKGMLTAEEAASALELTAEEVGRVAASLVAKGRIASVRTNETVLLSNAKILELCSLLTAELRRFHGEHPERRGMDADEAAKSISVRDVRFVKELISLFEKMSWVETDDGRVRLKGFRPFDEAKFMSDVVALKSFLSRAGYAMPTVEEASGALGLTRRDMDRLIAYLKERGELAIAGDGFLLSSDTESDFRKKLTELDGDITLARVRDITGSSRKYILPLLEYFDARGFTRRIGDKRILMKAKR